MHVEKETTIGMNMRHHAKANVLVALGKALKIANKNINYFGVVFFR
jgi:hypothetical protein